MNFATDDGSPDKCPYPCLLWVFIVLILLQKDSRSSGFQNVSMSNRVTGGHVRVLGGEDGAGGEVEAGAVGVAGGGLLRAAGGHASA